MGKCSGHTHISIDNDFNLMNMNMNNDTNDGFSTMNGEGSITASNRRQGDLTPSLEASIHIAADTAVGTADDNVNNDILDLNFGVNINTGGIITASTRRQGELTPSLQAVIHIAADIAVGTAVGNVNNDIFDFNSDMNIGGMITASLEASNGNRTYYKDSGGDIGTSSAKNEATTQTTTITLDCLDLPPHPLASRSRGVAP